MSAGLPGFGLGGIFFILSALLAPVFELPRTLRGRSSRARWGRIAGHMALALAMIVALEVALEILVTALGIGVSHAGHDAATAAGRAGSHAAATEPAGSGVSLAPLPVPPIAITAALLAGILMLAKAAQVAVRLRLRSRFAHAILYLAVAFTAARRRPAEHTDS